MRRREFITIGSVALAWPFGGSAQQPTKAALPIEAVLEARAAYRKADKS